MISLLLSYHLNQGKRFFSEHKTSRIVISTISILFGGFVSWGLFLLFRGGIDYIETQDFVGKALLEYMYQSFFLIITFFIWISTIIFILFRIAKSDIDAWLIESPKAEILPLYWAGLSFIVSTPIIIAILPELLAAHTIYGLSAISWMLGILSIAAFLIAVVGMGLASLAITMKILTLCKALSLRAIIIFFSLIGICFLIGIAYVTVWQDTTQVFQAEIIDINQANPEQVTRAFAWTPGYLMAQLLLTLHTNNVIEATVWLIGLSVIGLLSFAVYWGIMQSSLLSLWTSFRAANRARPHVRKTFPTLGTSVNQAIAEKEILSIIRNKKDILWVGFVGLLWGLTMAMTRRAPEITLETITDQDRFIVYGVWGVSMYFTFLILLRFVFTSFIYDQPFQWILLSSPISQLKLYLGKLSSFLGLGTILIIALVSFASWLLELPLMIYIFILLLGVGGVFFGTTLSLALGSNFLKTSRKLITRDQASTSLPGLMFVLITCLWSVLAVISLEQGIMTGQWNAFTLFCIISFLSSYVFNLITRLKIRNLST